MRRVATPLLAGLSLLLALAVAYGTVTADRAFMRLVAAGDEAAQRGDQAEALEAYSGALALLPDAVAPYLKRARLYQSAGQTELALRDLRRAADLDPSSTRPVEWLGDWHLANDRVSRAVDYYRRATALEDRNDRLLIKLATAQLHSDQADEALATVDRALALRPDASEARYLRALILLALGQDREALFVLDDLVASQPGHPPTREALAAVSESLGDYRRAVDELSALSVLEPDRPSRAVAVAMAMTRIGRDADALDVLERARERFPSDADVLATLGHAWLVRAERTADAGALQKASTLLATATAQRTPSSTALSDWGRVRQLQGDFDGAAAALERAVATPPVAPEAYLRLATVRERRGEPASARGALEAYAALVGDRAPLVQVSLRLTELCLTLGDAAGAGRWLERAESEATDDPPPDVQARITRLRRRLVPAP